MKIKATLSVFIITAVLSSQSFAHPAHGHQADVQTPKGAETSPVFQSHLILPDDLPEAFSITVPSSIESLTLQLQKNQIFGKNTKWLIDDGTGSLKQIDLGEDGSYLGKVVGHSDFSVSAVLTEAGLLANIIRPGKETITVEPVRNAGTLHQISIAESNDHISKPVVDMTTHTENVEASIGPITTSFLPLTAAVTANVKSTATLKPEKVMDVLEYEIGVEIGSRAFLADTYGGDMEKAKASAQSLVGNLDARYLHSAGIKHRLGTVLIRTDAKKDPLRDKVKKGDVGGLNAFRDFWNKNPNKVGDTHDLAVYHVYYPPSGIAYVNTIGHPNRYALSCGRGATSWADGTIAHEFGHSWNLHHNNKSGFFYENRPRNPRGADKAGGRDHHVSIMHGGGNHNIGRLATEEANMVYKIRQQKRKYGDLLEDPGPIRPYGHRDITTSNDSKPLTIDVIANDYDCNNDVLDAQLLDTVSYHGGAVSLSKGTGPGKRNEITYAPPAGFGGRDFFHYTVIDSTGRKDWGAVYVTIESPVVVDLKKDVYNYDLGPQGSPVRKGWSTITPKTKGDINWKHAANKPLDSRDRGLGSGVNVINRDFVYGAGKTILSHKIANGVWAVTINLGDRTAIHDRMSVKAEGSQLGSRLIDSGLNEYPYCNGEVTVTDGELNIEFSDKGGKDPNWVVTRFSLQKVK